VGAVVVAAVAGLFLTRSGLSVLATPGYPDSKIASLAVHGQGWALESSFQIGVGGAHPFSDAAGAYVASIDPAAAVLLGNEWIRVADESKLHAGGPQAKLTLRAPADVYLVVDDRWGSPPAWIGPFADTGFNVQLWEGRERETLQFSVFRLTAASGTVVLPSIGGSTGFDYFVVID
jgi:hypothetical protein